MNNLLLRRVTFVDIYLEDLVITPALFLASSRPWTDGRTDVCVESAGFNGACKLKTGKSERVSRNL